MEMQDENRENTGMPNDLPVLDVEEIIFADQFLSSKKAFAIVGIVVGVFIIALFSLSSSAKTSYLKDFDFSKNSSSSTPSEQKQVAGEATYGPPGRPSPTPVTATPTTEPTPTPTPTPQPDTSTNNPDPTPTPTPSLKPTSTPEPTPEENISPTE